jgi:multiple sugar transport system substrate-binding protein
MTSSVSRRALLGALPVTGTGVAAALSACTSGSTGALGGGGSSGEVTELIVPTARTPWLDAYRALAASYEDVSGIRIVLREFPYDGLYTQQINAIQSSALPFDIFQIDEAGLWKFFENEWVVPFDEIDSRFSIDADVLDYAGLPYWDPKTKTSDTSGHVMGYPVNGNMDLFVYRRDLYDELGLSVPATWEEALHNAQEAKASGKIQYGHVPRAQATQNGLSVTYEFMPVFYSYGGTWFADEGSDWTPTIDTDAGIAAATMFRDLALTGPEEPATIGQAEVISLMQGGKALQTHVVAAAASQFLDEDKSQIADVVGFAEVPAAESAGSPAPTSGTWSLCVPRGLAPERAKAALDYIRWVLSEGAQTEFMGAGGIPTCRSVLETGASTGTASAYLEPLAQSMDDVRAPVRYSFGPAMAAQTEKHLSRIAAGDVDPGRGMAELQDAVVDVVKEAGFLS